MAFLDNSGDIILDAVLTDHGRKVLSKGDGSFQITKFALGDEEINYSLYQPNHISGSAYYDLEILQTPVLESFTNNASSMKTKLLNLSNQNLLYLPVLKVNNLTQGTELHASGAFFVAVDAATEGVGNAAGGFSVGVDVSNQSVQGFLYGENLLNTNAHIRIDGGLDTTEISPLQPNALANLEDDTFIIQIDGRLGSIAHPTNGLPIASDYEDDDRVVFYTVDASDGLVEDNTNQFVGGTETIAGPRGQILRFRIQSSQDLRTSTYLFTQLGGTTTLPSRATADSTQSVRFIDSMIRITGMTTGYTLDIPVRFIKTITS